MKKLSIFVALIAIAGLCAVVWYMNAIAPVHDAEGRVQLQIDPGTGVSGIASALHERGLIASPLAFKLYARLHGLDGKLQAGNFVFQHPVSVAEIAGILQSGKTEEISVTIPEGFTVTDIDALLVRRGLTETGALIDCARNCDFSAFDFLPARSGLADRGGQVEGYLYPDTYFVATDGFSTEAFLKRLLQTFEQRVVTTYASDVAASGRSLHDVITMASLIEEEAITDEERPVIAGILWKRLDANQGLGVDATVRYMLNKPTAAITLQDLNENNPYNTRKFRGLPPGPIANASIESIQAALQPEASPYWYYLHDPNGRIHYAETNEAHNINRMRYLN